MEFTKFEIVNFKGIEKVVFDLQKSPTGKVLTLIGLNESGKTTVLEALSKMGRKPYDVVKSTSTNANGQDFQSYIPISKRYNFTGKINLIAHIKFSETDRSKIKEFIENKLGLKAEDLQDSFTINKTITYKDSNEVDVMNWWSLVPTVRKKHGRLRFNLESSKYPGEWEQLAKFVEPMVPHILYFRNEVFDFPEKIYLSKGRNEDGSPIFVDDFYSEVVQDILDTITPRPNIEEHIVGRKLSVKESDKQNLEGLLQKIGHNVTSSVMHQWQIMFQRKLQGKRIRVVCDKNESGDVYLQFKLEDGAELFDINERSSGFKWFFVFILLTEYRAKRNHAAIFLYDEPASNLHSSAQFQLIECFKRLPEPFRVIYSTHSHYLVNPEWLDSSFIVANEGINYESNSELEWEAQKTKITLTPYRRFVSENPSKLSYFQPVLDVLQYRPSKLESTRNCVFVEGKNDFYTISYLVKVCLGFSLEFDVMPCMGSGTIDQLISLYCGWGRNVVVLLDADKAGVKEKDRYLEKFGAMLNGRVISYADIEPAWKSKELEKILDKNDVIEIQAKCFHGDTKFNKDKFNLAVQELLVNGKKANLSNNSVAAVQKIVKKLEALLR